MYILLDEYGDVFLRDLPQARIIHKYPACTLAEVDGPPTAIPREHFEVLDEHHIHVHGQPVSIPDGVMEFDDAPHTLVRFIGPLAPQWRQELDRAQVRILFWCPRFGGCLRLPDHLRTPKLTDTFSFIAGARPYQANHCTRQLTDAGHPARRYTGLPDGLMDIVCFDREDRLRVEHELEKADIPILARSSSKIRVRFDGHGNRLRDLVGVKLADEARAPTLLTTGGLLEIIGASQGGERTFPFTGRGQIVAVADSGLDGGIVDETLHLDFKDRVRHIASWPINASWAPFVSHPGADDGAADRNTGHGTHVAGLAVGDGARSNGKHRGVAPEAQLVFQAIEQYTDVLPDHAGGLSSGYYLSGRPLDLRKLFEQARTFGARIHINAWGDAARGQYTDDCYESDLFLHEHPDALILFASGNEGADKDGDRSIDRYSLYAPASAKNVVAVGAVEGGVLGIGFRGDWGDLDENSKRFLNRDDRQDPISGEPDRIALFSSAGPSADGRIKPDICAPGTNLAAPRSSQAQGKGWGLASPMPHYMYYGGTSMATGVAGGFAALLRQAWQENLSGRPPSGMALKALMIIGAQPVLRRKDDRPEPEHIAGFGRLNLSRCIPGQPPTAIRLYDEVEPGLTVGEKKRYDVHMPASGTFKAVLTWYDAPGETLVNDLDLCLVDADGHRIWGNHGHADDPGPDRRNTVETIFLPDLAPGEYRLEVTAANIPEPPQPFALAVIRPTPENCAFETGHLKGIGKSYAQRLEARGITAVYQLFGHISQLADLLDIGSGGAALIAGRLQLLQTTIAGGRPADVAETQTLENLFNGLPPRETSQAAWNRARQALLPLRLVFDRRRLKTITLRDLFG